MIKICYIFSAFILVLLLGLSGCNTQIENMTPTRVPANPSGIYTLSAYAKLSNQSVMRESMSASIVIDGETHQMSQSEVGEAYFDYDYTMPENRDSARFYYVLDYKFINKDKVIKDATVQSSIEQMKLIDRYSISLDTSRAPIGTSLAVLGRGFSRRDKVYVGGVEANTRFISSNTLQYIVPNVTPAMSHLVEVRGVSTESAGTLKVDPALPLRVIPDSLTLQKGQRQALAFAMDNPAPMGGLYINVTTDIPSSVIMPEVIIPETARTVNIAVQAGEPGAGSLYIQGPGMNEIVIPITVE
ncbi:MAG: IPT/TIG domain-containing protein [Verrucomicrobiota bacterium]|nr:IPT/TIG domain-containing protein [Verrucomicrobiota bacterium]